MSCPGPPGPCQPTHSPPRPGHGCSRGSATAARNQGPTHSPGRPTPADLPPEQPPTPGADSVSKPTHTRPLRGRFVPRDHPNARPSSRPPVGEPPCLPRQGRLCSEAATATPAPATGLPPPPHTWGHTPGRLPRLPAEAARARSQPAALLTRSPRGSWRNSLSGPPTPSRAHRPSGSEVHRVDPQNTPSWFDRIHWSVVSAFRVETVTAGGEWTTVSLR